MALKVVIQFPIFAQPSQPHHRRATEIRFSRWNNANAQKFIRKERSQKEIEDELRRVKRFNSAEKIANAYEDATTAAGTRTFKSTGTPSTPSRPSIPGKASKYSQNPQDSHPAFRPISRVTKVPIEAEKVEMGVKISEDGVSYVMPDAPFAFQYSYTETPKEKPVKLREPPMVPFGPGTMPRPWTGRKPLAPSKKKLEFDSFKLPPPQKKGVKPVQAPGPFLPGSGPKYVQSREEILGEPLTKEEIVNLLEGCRKTKRQLNMGRDGLTHNMLDNIHAHWKRRRVCKIKCKGVCTVDMENVCQQLEERTGGKIIYNRGGVIYLFRGRNYNYRTRPRFPLMLWKPVAPVYPRLIRRAPEGLTLEEASEMRKRGRKLTPICKLGKNGVYCNLIKDVREAFEACDLVRINCQGMNGSDYRKIGAKLKDLIPCVLISFEHEHILMWRGRDWKSSLPIPEDDFKDAKKSETDDGASITTPLECQRVTESCFPDLPMKDTSPETPSTTTSTIATGNGIANVAGDEDLSTIAGSKDRKDRSIEVKDIPSLTSCTISTSGQIYGSETPLEFSDCDDDDSDVSTSSHGSKALLEDQDSDNDQAAAMVVGSDTRQGSVDGTDNHSGHLSEVPLTHDMLQDVLDVSETSPPYSKPMRLISPCNEGVAVLLKQALECGSAVVLDDPSLDADIVYKEAVALSQSAPPGPVFRRRPRKVAVHELEKQEPGDSEAKVSTIVSEEIVSERKRSRNKKKTEEVEEDYLDVVVPKGSLRVDELAKLLA